MQIAMRGNFEPEHSTENDVRKTLIYMGHRVLPIQESRADLPTIRQACQRSIFLLWMHTHGWDHAGIFKEWLADLPCPTVAYTLDLFRGLARHDPEYVATHPWFACDWFFQPDGTRWLIDHKVNALHLPPAILRTSCYLAEPIPGVPDIVFVGSRNYHPEWPWRQELIAFLEKQYKDRVGIYEHSSGLRGHRLNQVYASAKVVVGDSCFASTDSPYTSDRLYESIGRGANLVYPRVGTIPTACAKINWYSPGDTMSLQMAIESALDRPPTLRHRQEQVNITAACDTYENRLRSMLEEIEVEG